MDILHTAIRKAKTNHVCNYCLQIIQKGDEYQNSSIKSDDVYTWKNHLDCAELCEKLKMFDRVDEGVTSSDFQEEIHEEYSRIMSLEFNSVWESAEFKMPKFSEKLLFVKERVLNPMPKN